MEHLPEQRLGHEVRAGAGREIAAARQHTHCLEVDLLVAAYCVLDRSAAFRERGRVEDNEVVGSIPRLVQIGEQIENVRDSELHIREAIQRGVFSCQFDRVLADIDRIDQLSTCRCGIQRERSSMRKAMILSI